MQVYPQQVLVEKHVEGLGFTLQDKGKKTCRFSLTVKNNDYRLMLALAHYSLRLSSVFVNEQCFAFVVDNYFRVKEITKPLTLQELYEKGMQLICLFRNEHIY